MTIKSLHTQQNRSVECGLIREQYQIILKRWTIRMPKNLKRHYTELQTWKQTVRKSDKEKSSGFQNYIWPELYQLTWERNEWEWGILRKSMGPSLVIQKLKLNHSLRDKTETKSFKVSPSNSSKWQDVEQNLQLKVWHRLSYYSSIK